MTVGCEVLWRLVQKLSPYLLLELLLPGGTVIATLLYLYRSRKGIGPADRNRLKEARNVP